LLSQFGLITNHIAGASGCRRCRGGLAGAVTDPVAILLMQADTRRIGVGSGSGTSTNWVSGKQLSTFEDFDELGIHR
jgi:hypothetical protein